MLRDEKYPTFIEITGKEKRYKPTKHNVFIVHVQWSDNSRVPIYRQYCDFSQLHTQLQEFTINLPETEANVKLPAFPNKKEFWRPDSNKNDDEKKAGCNEYFRKVLSYEILSKSQAMVDFFMPKPDDIKPASGTSDNQGRRKSKTFSLFGKKEEPKKLNLQTNGTPSPNNRRKVKEEDEHVYVSRPRILESYLVTADYQSTEEGHVTLKEGHFVQVIEKNTNGWWLLSTEYGDGWGPASHLQSLSGLDQDEEEIYSGSKYITTNSYAASNGSHDEISFAKGAMIDVLHKRNDGWWVIKYQSKVGYAPAMYMTAYKNPHYYQRRPSASPTSDTSEAAKSDDKQKEKCIPSDQLKSAQDTRSESVKSAAWSEENLSETEESRSQQGPVDQEVTQQREKADASISKRTRSSDSFGDELECVTSWIDQSALKRIQEEDSKKRDYTNIPQIAVSHTNDKSTPSDTLKSCSQNPEKKTADVAKPIAAGVDDSTKGKDHQLDDKQSSIDRYSLEPLENGHKPNKTEQGESAGDEHDLELDYINIPKIGVAKKLDSVEEPDWPSIPSKQPHIAKSIKSTQASCTENDVTKSAIVSSAPVKEQQSLTAIDVQSVQSNACAESHPKDVVGGNTIKTSDTTGTILNPQSNRLHEDDIDTRVNQLKSAKPSNVITNQSATASASLEQTKWSYGDPPQSNATVISHSLNSEVKQLQMAVLQKQLEKLDRENIKLDAETEILNMKKTKLSLEIEMVKLQLQKLKEGNSLNLYHDCRESDEV